MATRARGGLVIGEGGVVDLIRRPRDGDGKLKAP